MHTYVQFEKHEVYFDGVNWLCTNCGKLWSDEMLIRALKQAHTLAGTKYTITFTERKT